MSKKKISRPDQMLLWEDSLVSPLVSQAPDKPKTTPDISGQICFDLSRNYGPIGSLEKTLLASSTWAWTRYSLTWKTRVTPQGRLIFQLARSAHRTNGTGSGSLRTSIVEANPNQPDPNNKVSTSEMWATPNTMDHLPPRDEEDCSTNQNNRKGRTRSGNLREQVVHENMWPTPRASGQENPESLIKRKGEKAAAKHNLTAAVKMWPTPNARDWKDSVDKVPPSVGKTRGHSLGQKVAAERELYPTPTSRDWRDTGNLENTEQRKDGRIRNDSLPRVISQEIFPTPNAWDAQRGPQKKETLRDKNHQVNLIDAVTHTTPDHLKKDGGSLNPQWVAWLMGYPTEYLNSVPWETRSSRKSSKKSD